MRPILIAAWFGHKGAVQMLVENGANLRSVNRQGLTLLHCCIKNDHSEIANYLLESAERLNINATDKVSRENN